MTFVHYKIKKFKKHYHNFNYNLFRYQRIFFGSLIFRGRKIWAYNFFIKVKYGLKIKENIDPNILFLYSLLKITPCILLLPLKIGGKVQGVPLPISWKKRLTYSTKWVIKLLKEKNKRVKLEDVVEVLILALYNKGLSFEKKINTYKEGRANRFLIKYFK